MNLYINSPSYYSQIHGIDDDIYKMCRLLEKNIDIKKYTSLLDTVGITPIVAPNFEINGANYAEVKYISLPYRMASISLHIDYLEYISVSIEEKKALIIKNILNSLLVIKKRLKNGFDYVQLENDILTLVKSPEEI